MRKFFTIYNINTYLMNKFNINGLVTYNKE